MGDERFLKPNFFIMLYRLVADLVLLLHLSVILFMIFGGFLSWWRRWIAAVHIPAAIYGVLISTVGWVCPLTPLENRFRHLAGQEGYEGSFIEHYVLNIIYPPGMTVGVQTLLAVGLILLMAIAYGVPVIRRVGGGR